MGKLFYIVRYLGKRKRRRILAYFVIKGDDICDLQNRSKIVQVLLIYWLRCMIVDLDLRFVLFYIAWFSALRITLRHHVCCTSDSFKICQLFMLIIMLNFWVGFDFFLWIFKFDDIRVLVIDLWLFKLEFLIFECLDLIFQVIYFVVQFDYFVDVFVFLFFVLIFLQSSN